MRTMGSYEVCQSSHKRESRGRKTEKGIVNEFKGNMTENFPK